MAGELQRKGLVLVERGDRAGCPKIAESTEDAIRDEHPINSWASDSKALVLIKRGGKARLQVNSLSRKVKVMPIGAGGW